MPLQLGPLQERFIQQLEEGYTNNVMPSELALTEIGYKDLVVMCMVWYSSDIAKKLKANPEHFFTESK